MLKKLFSHSLIYAIAPQVASIAGILALPVITKDLTTVDYGVWGVLMAYTGALQALAILGMGVVLSNAFFKMPRQYKWLWRQIYGMLLLWALPYGLIVGCLLYFVMPVEAQEHTLLLIFLLLAPNVLFGPTSLLGTYYYQLNQRPVPIVVRTTLFGLLTVGLSVYTISHLKMGYLGWAWTNFIVTVLMNASYWYVINVKLGYRPIFNFKRRTIRRALNVSLPTIPHTYAAYLLDSSDRIVMDRLQVSTSNLGIYNLAAKFGGYFRALTTGANKAVAPMMLKAYKEGKDEIARNLIVALQIAVLSGTFIFALWSREIFEILIKNEELKEAYPLAIVIVMAYNYRPMYTGALNKLYFLEKTQLLWRVSFIAGGLNVILNLILIPIYGFEVAAYTTFVAFMYMGFAGHFIPKIKEVHRANFYPLFWLGVIVLTSIIVSFAVELEILYKFWISIILLGAMTMFLVFNRKSLNHKFG
ncbi:polysaccharide biosynthesis protein [Lewinella sp. 4G2]|nr:polysaccharide biosynthesis protein [Lewinella sp. 4G2]